MSEDGSNVQLWRAFLLGARAALHAYSVPLKDANRERYVNLLGQIASGNEPLGNPTEIALLFEDPETARKAFENEHQLVRDDRELAQMILTGMADDLGQEGH
jgi:hypothetical protein